MAALWVTKRIEALGGRQGFVDVPSARADVYVQAGWAHRVFDPWTTMAPNDSAYVDNIVVVGVQASGSADPTSPVGTTVARAQAVGGDGGPYTYQLTGTDGGNFSITGQDIKTAKTGITEGAHTITVTAKDSVALTSAPRNFTVTIVAAPPPPELVKVEAEPEAEVKTTASKTAAAKTTSTKSASK